LELAQSNLAEIDQESRLELIRKVMSTYSPSGHERELAEVLRRELESKGLKARIDGAGNVLCETYGRGHRQELSLLLCGHMDTIPGEIPVSFENNAVRARGACDAKGPLLSLLFAFEDLALEEQAEVPAKIIFAGVTQEEQSSEGLTELIDNGIRADYAIFGEPGGVSKVTIGYRGHMATFIQITTPEFHSSAPGLGLNSAELLFELYNEVKSELGADTSSTEQYSVSLTQLNSGSAHNVVPGKTTATFDIRIPFGRSVKETKEKIEQIVSNFASTKPTANCSLAFDEPTESYRVALNSPLVRSITRAIIMTGLKPSLTQKSGTGDMNTYAHAFGVDAVTYGPGDAKLSHTPEEAVAVSEIFKGAKIIQSTARELVSIRASKSS
jgi:[amino group carrier protein]-lysine/ornithine hydrolase